MLRRVRLTTGLFLMVFVVCHLTNHAAGLFGHLALADGLRIFAAVWNNLPMQLVLLTVALLHMGLGLYAFFMRKSLRTLPLPEISQLLLGLLIPPLLVIHILGTAYAQTVYGLKADYIYILLVYFVFDPWLGIQQVLVLLIAWTHGSLGIWYWLRLKPGFARWRDRLLALLVIFPLFALAGIVAAGREVIYLAGRSSWLNARIGEMNLPNETEIEQIYALETNLLIAYGAVLALILAGRGFRWLFRGRSNQLKISYPGGRAVTVPLGTSILEASQLNGIAHASVCGGRGRCSTCRVRIISGGRALPFAKPEEKRVLRGVNAPPDVRLACQTRPLANVEVEPLLAPGVGPKEAARRPAPRPGEEREIAVLFADIRGFTSISEAMLPYDVVFLLNRYFRAIAVALEGAGGHVDKFIGDGVMALFGLDDEPDQACRQALEAAAAMGRAIDDINRALAHSLEKPLRIGIGIHVGTAVVGEMGYGAARALTAIGDTVNTASRLEQLTKEHGALLIVSEEAVERAGISKDPVKQATTPIRGRKEPLGILIVESLDLLSLLVKREQASGTQSM
ncbi:MAG: adenylate/guanylate cyclase domain-containing protein [Kiloniellales bacterium]